MDRIMVILVTLGSGGLVGLPFGWFLGEVRW